MTTALGPSTLTKDMLRDPSLTPQERAWWQTIADMAAAREAGASERELDRLTLKANRLAERCR